MAWFRRLRCSARGVLRSACFLCVAAGVARAEPPNIVLIISDDAGWADFGFNEEGNGQIPTPAIDSIAAGGRWFPATYTAPVCSPSRARMFLGQHQQRTGYDNNQPKSLDSTDAVVEGLALENITLFERLRAVGYHTGFFGKWHLGTERDAVSNGVLVAPGNLPPRHGINYFLGLTAGQRKYFTTTERDYITELREQTLDPVTGLVVDRVAENDYPAMTYMTDLLADEVAGYITDRHAAGGPFLAVLAFTAPHAPLQATDADLARVDALGDPGLTGDRRVYAAMMISMDDGVRTVLERLEDPNNDGDPSDSIASNTLVCFINDNGGQTVYGAKNLPLRGNKSDGWDGGLRVVMAMRGPGIPATGERYDDPVDSADLVPTFMAAAGAPLGPDDLTDGVNLLPYLDGTLEGPPHDAIFVRADDHTMLGARRDRWKLTIERYGGPFLYDIVADPGESSLLNFEHPEIADGLVDVMHGYEAEYMKPRWGTVNARNVADSFVYRAGQVGSAAWGAEGAWSVEGEPGSVTRLFARDGYANLAVRFPAQGTAYTATNDLRRVSLLEYFANRVVFSGDHSGAVASGVTIDGEPLLLVDSLAGELPAIEMGITSSGAGHPAEIGLELRLWDDLMVRGAGMEPLVLSGGIVEERAGRSVVFDSAGPTVVRGPVALSGDAVVVRGEMRVDDDGVLATRAVFVSLGASLRLGGGSGANADFIGNATTLDVATGSGPSLVLDFVGEEVVGDLVIDGVLQPLGVYGADTHPSVFSGPGRVRIRGPLACCAEDRDGNGYADFFDTLAFLRAFDAGAGCGPAVSGLPSGLAVSHEAWRNDGPAGLWANVAPAGDADLVWTFDRTPSPVEAARGAPAVITRAYAFPESAGTSESYEDVTRSPATMEVWFRAEALEGDQLIWEIGEFVRGAALWLSGDELRLEVRNGQPAPIRLATTIGPGWHQAVAVVNNTGNSYSLYVDGELRASAPLGSVARWSGFGTPGLGRVAFSVVGGLNVSPFEGQIGIYRLYRDAALGEAEVAAAYAAVMNALPGCDPGVDLVADGVLDAADVEAHLDALMSCESCERE